MIIINNTLFVKGIRLLSDSSSDKDNKIPILIRLSQVISSDNLIKYALPATSFGNNEEICYLRIIIHNYPRIQADGSFR